MRITGRSHRALSLILVVGSSITASTWAQNLEWVAQIGGQNGVSVSGVTLDGGGNVYVTGRFSGTTDFDPGAGMFNMTPADGGDGFLLKLDSGGNFIWAVNIGGDPFDHYVALDGAGNIYVTGDFMGTDDFDPGPGMANLTSAGGNDFYVLKLDSAATFVWVRGFGGIEDDESMAIDVDGSGNVFIAGLFRDTVDFDPGAETANLTATGADGFLWKGDTGGDFVWVHQVTSPLSGVAIGQGGNVFAGGRFADTFDFDPGPGVANLTSAGSVDGFVWNLTTSGDLIWVRSFGSTEQDAASAVAVDADGSVLACGRFRGTVDFDPGAGESNLTNPGTDNNAVVWKLTSAGGFAWARPQTSVGSTICEDVTVDRQGSVYAGGRLTSSADFDPGPGESILAPTGGTADGYVWKLSPDGEFVWAVQLADPNGARGAPLATDTDGSVYYGGFFNGPADFDPGPGVFELIPINAFDGFVWKLGQVCGNGSLDSGETCDPPQDGACPGECDAFCQCPPPPVCGNGIQETGEDCDAPDDGACAGQCGANCRCPDGACCTDGPGTQSDCVITSQSDCFNGGGLFLGSGTECLEEISCTLLVVNMEHMSAEATPEGVTVRWTTGMEVNTVGFRVLRDLTGSREKTPAVVGTIVHAMGTGLSGASYEVLDDSPEVVRAVRYYIEDIDVFGRVTRHGPIDVDRGSRQHPAARIDRGTTRQR